MTDTNTTALMWFSVQTPAVFREYLLPAEDGAMSTSERRQWNELLDLADMHHTTIECSQRRRG